MPPNSSPLPPPHPPSRRSRSRNPFRRAHRPINLSRGAFRQLAAALGIAAVVGLTGKARADWTLTTADMKDEPHLTVNTWSVDQGLSATDQSGKLSTIPTRGILGLSSGRAPPPDTAQRNWRLLLRNGDTLFGEATGISGKSLMFKVAELGPVAVPLKRVAMLSSPRVRPTGSSREARTLPASADHDLVVFKDGGDRLEGLFATIDDTKLQFLTEGADNPTDIALAKVDTIVLGGIQPPRTIPPLCARFTFAQSGSTLTIPLEGDSFSWTLNQLKIKDLAGQPHATQTDRLAGIEILGGRVVYLTELDPEKQEQVSFLGTSWPYQVNRNVLGQPLRVGGTIFPRGLGVHTQSTLAYQLDGAFDTLSLRVGMDDSAAPNGEAHAYVVLDGKVLWDEKSLKPGALSDELSLPIKGGRRLELHADPASRLDVQGRVDWINVALRRQ